MSGGITAQYGFLYQRYVFIKFVLENAGMGRFFVYEGIDDIDVTEESRISLIKEYNKQFIQVKSGSVSLTCWAKVIGNWLLIEDGTQTYKIILENKLDFDFWESDVINYVVDYFVSGSTKKSNSIANKVYKKYIKDSDETHLKNKVVEMLNHITIEVLSLDDICTIIKEIFISFYCSDIKRYEMAKNCRFDRFLEYLNKKIDEAIKEKISFTLQYIDFMNIINKVTAEISDDKYTVDIGEMRKRKKTEAERMVDSNDLREVRQLRLVNPKKGFIVNELVKELLYRDLRDVYTSSEDVMISNIEETAYLNYEDVLYSLPDDATPKQKFDSTVEKDIPIPMVNNSPLYRNGCYVYLTGEETEESRKISWGDEHE